MGKETDLQCNGIVIIIVSEHLDGMAALAAEVMERVWEE